MNETHVGGCMASGEAETDELDVTVVMPCLNEALTVGKCVDKALMALHDMGVRGEVVVADNGSVDGSPKIVREHGGASFPLSDGVTAALFKLESHLPVGVT